MSDPQRPHGEARTAWPDARTVWLDARGLQHGFKEHIGRGIGAYVASLAVALDAEAAEGRLRLLVERGADLIAGVPASRLLEVPVPLHGSSRLATQLRQHLILAAWITVRSPAAVHFPAQTDAPVFVGTRAVVTVHDVFLHRRDLATATGGMAATRLRVARALERLAVRRAARLIAPSRVTAQDLTRTLGVSPSRIAVIPEAARPGFSAIAGPDDVAVRARLRLPERYLLHSGRADPRKRLPELIAVFDAIARGDRDLHLVLVGPVTSGEAAPDVLRAIRVAAAADRIRLLGVVDEAAMPPVYRGALAVVLATQHEGFGLPVVEAFASGVPVVATAAPAILEVAGDAARLVPVDQLDALPDALREVIGNRALADDLRARGLARAAQFRWSRIAAETLQVYEEVTGETGLARG